MIRSYLVWWWKSYPSGDHSSSQISLPRQVSTVDITASPIGTVLCYTQDKTINYNLHKNTKYPVHIFYTSPTSMVLRHIAAELFLYFELIKKSQHKNTMYY